MYGSLARTDTHTHTVRLTYKPHRHPCARVANEFIRTTFDDRHQRVNSAMINNSKREIATGMDDLIVMINDGNEQRWQNLLRKIINCVALMSKCVGCKKRETKSLRNSLAAENSTKPLVQHGARESVDKIVLPNQGL